jgi:hypothetical protein
MILSIYIHHIHYISPPIYKNMFAVGASDIEKHKQYLQRIIPGVCTDIQKFDGMWDIYATLHVLYDEACAEENTRDLDTFYSMIVWCEQSAYTEDYYEMDVLKNYFIDGYQKHITLVV